MSQRPNVLVGAVRLAHSAALAIWRASARSDDGNETGGILLGHLRDDGTAEIRHAGGPGPHAIRQPAFFLRDLAHAQDLATEAFTKDGSVWIGEWHTHLVTVPVPSGRDLATYAELLDDPELGFDAIISVIVIAQGDWASPAAYAWACYPGCVQAVPLTIHEDPTTDGD